MRAFLSSVFVLILSAASIAQAGLSAKRLPGEDHSQASIRINSFTSMYSTPQRVSKPLAELDITKIPDVGSYADMENQFKNVRDIRIMEDPRRSPLRRLTWLYPDDGCFARAEMASHILQSNNFVTPKKIFVFGNLHAKTMNAPEGSVDWWYHVAVIYRIDKTAYVFDPAINPARPVTLQEWNVAVGGGTKFKYAICSHATFDPNEDCENPGQITLENAMSEQSTYLYPEWQRVLELGRLPEKELGEFPPWL